jgi:hypothetical protein
MIRINNIRELGNSLREGRWVWPGGYEKLFIANDGAVICFTCVNGEIKSVLDSMKNEINDGWRVIGTDATCNSDETPNCEHCNYEFEPENAV